MADTELIVILTSSIGGGIIVLLLVACIVCTACWGCLIYTTLNKLWDLAGKMVDKMEERRRMKMLRKAREERDVEVGDEELSEISDDYDVQLKDDDRNVDGDTSSDSE